MRYEQHKSVYSNITHFMNIKIFIITAQLPYLNRVIKAKASISALRLLNSMSNNDKHKNNVAVGLSGTNNLK